GHVDRPIGRYRQVVRGVEFRRLAGPVRIAFLPRSGQNGNFSVRAEFDHAVAAELGQHQPAIEEIHAKRFVEPGRDRHEAIRGNNRGGRDEQDGKCAHGIPPEIETRKSRGSHLLYGQLRLSQESPVMTPSLIFGLALAVSAPAPKDAAKPMPKIEGDWIIETYEGGPRPSTAEKVTMHFTEGTVTVRDGQREKPEE